MEKNKKRLNEKNKSAMNRNERRLAWSECIIEKRPAGRKLKDGAETR